MQRLSRPLRRTPVQVGARLLTALGAAALVLLLALSKITGPMDDALFDLMAGTGKGARSPQVVVVTIDPESLAQHGPWPWPRRDLAQLVDQLSAAGTRAVGLQLLLAQDSLYDPLGDAQLARALARNGAVVLPVMADLSDSGRTATAILPAPVLVAAAAALGHTEAVTDDNGISRRIALHAGLGTPQWPAFALALRDLASSSASRNALHVARSHTNPPPLDPADAGRWVRSDTVLVASPGSTSDIVHVTAAGVLNGQVGTQLLGGRIAIVGRTDPAAGQRLSLPGARNSLPHVDFQANALVRLLEDRAVWPMPVGPQVLLSVILVILPLLLLGLPGLRRLWAPMGIAMALVVLVSWALLMAGAWFPPLPALLVLAIGLVIGAVSAWRRARQRSFIDQATGAANRLYFDHRLDGDTRRARRNGQPLSLLLVEARGATSQAPGGGGNHLTTVLAAGLRLRAQQPQDLVARLDAGRFAALLPGTAPHVAAALATALMVDLEGYPGHPGPVAAGQVLRMGLASLQPEDSRGTDLLLRATRDLITMRDPPLVRPWPPAGP
jgi:CHASE2 domain-containing sensor protein